MSDGRFSSKPLRGEKARDIAWRAGEFTADAPLLPDTAWAFLRSAALQREVDALQDQPFPTLTEEFPCAPLPKNAPAGAGGLGRPIASATLVQEFLIGFYFLCFCGWVFMFFGALIALIAVIALLVETPQPGRSDPLGIAIAGAVGLAIGGMGAWFAIFRGRDTEICWLCPRGMIWMTNGVFDWFVWQQVGEVYCLSHAVRPAIGIRFDRNLSTISFRQGKDSSLMVEYIESRASAACVSRFLHLLADERDVSFGCWHLSQSVLAGPDGKMYWRDVVAMRVWDRKVCLRHCDGSDLTVSLDEVSFPSLFTALARGLHAFARETASEL